MNGAKNQYKTITNEEMAVPLDGIASISSNKKSIISYWPIAYWLPNVITARRAPKRVNVIPFQERTVCLTDSGPTLRERFYGIKLSDTMNPQMSSCMSCLRISFSSQSDFNKLLLFFEHLKLALLN